MKFILILLLVCVTESFASEILSQKSDLELTRRETPLQQVLDQIEEQTEYRFLYNNETVKDKFVKLDVKDKDFYEILDQIKKTSDVNYLVLESNLIVLTPVVKAQPITITGTVTDESTGEPLPGVYVIEQGNTTNGTMTDTEGSYSITVASEDAILRFSFVGYNTTEVRVGSQTTLNVGLATSMEELEDIVVVGYGTVKKSDLTGSVSSIRDEDLNQGAISSIDQAMQGQIAGVQVTQTSSEPGGGLSIRIRGASSVNAGNEPLYVIDGFPIDNSPGISGTSQTGQVAEVGQNRNSKNPLNSLNPNDIQSIEILKDASATAIYGSRGANGVVLITTKKGSGGIKFNYDAYGGFQQIVKKIDVLETDEYIETINALSNEQGGGDVFSAADIAQIGAGTDWQDEIFQIAPVQSHNLSVSGGVQQTNFYVSLNYFNQDGIVKRTGTKRYIARINVNQKIGEKFNFGVNINTSRENNHNAVDGLNTNESAGPINTSQLYDPTEPIFDAEGRYAISTNLNLNNPLATIYGITSQSEVNRIFGNLTADYEIIPSLIAKINLGFDSQNMRRDVYNSTKTRHGRTYNGLANVAALNRSNILAEYTMNYSREISANQSVNLLAGATYQDFISKRFSAGTSNFPSDDLMTNNLGLGDPANATISSNKEGYTLLSYLARANYSLYSFLLTASIRADGSSRFGADNKWGYFPSFAFGWKISEQDFIPNVFSELKLRASWGQTGNQEISNYRSLSTYTDGGVALLNGNAYTGTQPSRIANPELKWETTAQLDLGVDFGILRGRISGSFDYFDKETTDMLLNLPLPSSSGFSSILKNAGSMKNTGVELMLVSRNIDRSNLLWRTTLNVSAVQNEVISLGGLDRILTGSIQEIGNTTIIEPGSPLNSYYGYRIIGIFQDQAEIDGYVQPTAQPGYPKFENVNGDGIISTADEVILGDPFPDFTFGMRNSVTYRDFVLDFFFQGQSGAELLNNNAIESMYPANFRRNRIEAQIKDRWTPSNPGAKWPSGANPSSYDGGKVTNLVVEDASYIRLKSLQLTYNIPVKILGIQSARVYILGQNLFTITDYSGFDPEANSFGQSNVRVDYSSYPLARTWMLGLNVQF